MDQMNLINIKANANFKAKFCLMMFVLFGISLLRVYEILKRLMKYPQHKLNTEVFK